MMNDICRLAGVKEEAGALVTRRGISLLFVNMHITAPLH